MTHYFLIFTLIFTVLVYLPSTGQNIENIEKQENMDDIVAAGVQAVAESYDHRYEGVKGTPYLFSDWMQGEIIMRDSSILEQVLLRYDVYQDELIAKRSNNNEIVIDKNQIRGFSLGKPGISNFTEFRTAEYLKDFKVTEPDQFVQVLYDGPTALYTIKKKDLSNAKFTDTVTDFYIQSPEGNFMKVRPNKKEIMEIFKDEKKKVEEFIEKNNLILEESTDLVKVVMFYDQLHS